MEKREFESYDVEEDYKLSKELIMEEYGMNLTREQYALMNETVNGTLPDLGSMELYEIFEDIILG